MDLPLPATISDLRTAIASGSIDPTHAIERQHQRFGADAWHAVVDCFAPASTQHAVAQPLSGVGLAHKDIFVLPDHMPACGSHGKPAFDAAPSPVVQRLQQAGASNLGTLCMAEFACGITGENPDYPRPVNPLNPAYAVGGSSSGSGVALAAALCYGSLGTDTAGSVRVPAATCGVLGLKPTNGSLEAEGCFPLAPSLDTIGILARSASDCALLFKHAVSAQVQPKLAPLDTNTQLRVTLVTEHPRANFSAPAAMRQLFIQMADRVADLRAALGGIDNMAQMIKNAAIILQSEAAHTHYARLQMRALPELRHVARATSLPGAALPTPWYLSAIDERAQLRERFIKQFFSQSDILLTPVLPQGVPLWSQVDTSCKSFDAQALLAMLSWTSFVNYLGLPAMVCPIGIDDNGMPISVQAIASPWQEAKLLQFAQRLEAGFFAAGKLTDQLTN